MITLLTEHQDYSLLSNMTTDQLQSTVTWKCYYPEKT